MIRSILIIAAREFRQIVASRSFWVTLLILPLGLAVTPLLSHADGAESSATVVIADPSGQIGPAAWERLQLLEQRRALTTLARYIQRHGLDHVYPGAIWTEHDHFFTDQDVRAFQSGGGIDGAVREVARQTPPGVPPFVPPQPYFRLLPTPPALAQAAPGALARMVPDILDPPEAHGAAPIDYVITISASPGWPGNTVRVWSDEPPPPPLLSSLQQALSLDARTRILEAHGVSADLVKAADAASPRIALITSPPEHGGEARAIRSVLPLLVSSLLLLTLMLTGSWMLQGLVDERSNKLLEALLACVSPGELMYGKLIGTMAVGLTLVLIWSTCAIAIAFASHGEIADTLRPALLPLAQPDVAIAMIYFFVAGYAMMAAVFLAIGAVSDSFRDAQSYLSPVMLVVAVPAAIIAQTALHDPNSPFILVLQWIPPFIPFAVVARLGSGVPAWQLIASGLVLAGFVTLEILLLGRVFRVSLLAAGARFSPVALVRRLVGGRA